MSNKSTVIWYGIWGILNFLIFAYDIEHDRDFWTWLWLLNAMINFAFAFKYLNKSDNEPR